MVVMFNVSLKFNEVKKEFWQTIKKAFQEIYARKETLMDINKHTLFHVKCVFSLLNITTTKNKRERERT